MMNKPLSTLIIVVVFGVSITLLTIGCENTSEPEEPAKLLLISIDGFRADYTELYETLNLSYIAEQGIQAEYMIPVFPTKTFPNHYSIATGLYPENSGIIANNMYDPEIDSYYSLEDRASVQDASWYNGEPIWVTAEKQGIPTAPLFWPGSEAPIGGNYASRWSTYNDDLPYSARVDSVLTWLQLEEESAPGFMTIYFSKVDTYGHWYGPNSDSTAAAVKQVDEYIGRLFEGIAQIGYGEKLNIIIVSDHGMADVSDDKVILLDKIFNLDDAEIIDWAPVTTINPNPGKTDEIFRQLKKQEKYYTVYKKEDIPNEFRYKHNHRVPPIVLVAETGYTVTSTVRLQNRAITGGDHGYPPTNPEMRSLFIAAGPNILQEQKIEPFQSIHLYEFMAALLEIDPAPNDGHIDSLKHILNPYK